MNSFAYINDDDITTLPHQFYLKKTEIGHFNHCVIISSSWESPDLNSLHEPTVFAVPNFQTQ